jgi:AbrB family transcriptional regulator (stage V sporulation protein T)
MKATGIIRRIDDLGRIVIPKELRRTYKMKEGDPVEIFTNDGGELILKKFSPINDISSFSNAYAEALNFTVRQTVLICDTDTVISASGNNKKDYLKCTLHSDIQRALIGRKNILHSKRDSPKLFAVKQDEAVNFYSQIIVPILVKGDAYGAVIMLSYDPGYTLGQNELNLCITAASFFASQLD